MNLENNNGLENTNPNTEKNINEGQSIGSALFGEESTTLTVAPAVTPQVSEPTTTLAAPVMEKAPATSPLESTAQVTPVTLDSTVPTSSVLEDKAVAPQNAEKFTASAAPQMPSEIDTSKTAAVPTLEVATDINLSGMGTSPVEPPKEEPKKKKSNVGLIIVIVIILLAALVGGAYYYYTNYLATPYTITKKVVGELFGKSNNALETFEIASDKTVRLSGNVSFDTNMEELLSFKDIKGSFLVGLDPVNNKLEAGLTLNADTTYTGSLYYINNGVYGKTNLILNDTLIKFEDLQNLEYNVSDYTKYLNNDDMDYINEKLSEYIQKSLNENDFKKRTVEINGKKYTDNYIVINNDNYKIMLKSIINNIENDSKFVEIICGWADITTDTFNEYVKELVTELDEYQLEKDITISSYTSGILNNDYYGTSITVGSEKVFDIIDNKASFYSDGKAFCTLTINENSYVFDLTEEDNNINVTVTYSVTSNKVEYTIAVKVTNGSQYVTVNVNLTEEVGATVADITTTSAKSSNELTADDLASVYAIISAYSSYLYGNDYADTDYTYTTETCGTYTDCVCTDNVCTCLNDFGSYDTCTK